MDELSIHLKALQRVTFMMMSVCLMLWAFVPSLRGIAAGLILGIVIGFINSQFLVKKIRIITNKVLQDGGGRFNLGLLTRFAMAILGAMVTLRFEEVNVYAMVAGLLLMQFIIVIIGFKLVNK